MADLPFQRPDSAQPGEQNSSLLQDGVHKFTSLFLGDSSPQKDPGKTDYRAEVEHYAVEALKTVPLFLPGSGRIAWKLAAYGGSALLQGLDQVHEGDSTSRQVTDFSLGLVKGATTKLSFDLLGRADFSRVNKLVDVGLVPRALAGKPLELTSKAFSFGLTNRLVDTSLTTQTWLDNSGNVDIRGGVSTTVGDMIRPSSLLTDVGVFMGSPILIKGANLWLRGAIDHSPLLQTVATGSSFGFLSGSLSEVQRQYHEDAQYDPAKIFMRGAFEAGASGLGATVGGYRANYLAAQAAFRPSASEPQRLIEPFSAAMEEQLSYANMPETPLTPGQPLPRLEAGATPHQLLQIKSAEHVGTHINPDQHALYGAKQYRTEDGQEFWQLSDGRIFRENSRGQSNHPSYEIWVPHASEGRYSSGFLQPVSEGPVEIDGSMVRKEKLIHLELDERHGFYRDPSGLQRTGISKANSFDLAADDERRPKVDEQKVDALHMSAERPEKDWLAAVRIMPTESGASYEQSTIKTWQKVSTVKMNGQPTDIVQQGETPGRIYRILTQDQAAALADLNDQLSAKTLTEAEYAKARQSIGERAVNVLVTEEFGQKLDALRDLRKTATLSPPMVPEIAEDILAARRDLFTSPYRNQLLPEHWGQFLDTLPDRRLLKQLYLLDGDSTQYGHPKTFFGDALTAERRVRIFTRNMGVDSDVRETTKHEWWHLAEGPNKAFLAALTAARRLESFIGRGYGAKNEFEHWTVLSGEVFVNPNSELFLSLAHLAPVKASIISEALSQTMSSALSGSGSTDAKILQDRIDHVRREVEPKAREGISNGMESRKPDLIAGLADLAATLSAHPSTRPLLNRLFDAQKLRNVIDNTTSEKRTVGQFDWQWEARRLLRLQILKALEPAEFAKRQADYDLRISSVSAFTRMLLLSAEHPESKDALSLAKGMADIESLRPMFQRLFPADDLLQAALDTKHPDQAKTAFELLAKDKIIKVPGQAALKIINTDSPAKLDAARYLMSDQQFYLMDRGEHALSQLMDKRVPEFISPDMAKILTDGIDQQLNTIFHYPRAEQLMYRGALLEKLVSVNPELNNEDMQKRLGHIANLKTNIADRVRQSLSAGSAQDQRAALSFLDSLSLSADPALKSLTKELAPRAVLEQAIRTGTARDPKIFTVANRLYGSDMTPVLSQAVSTPGPLRIAALGSAFSSVNNEFLKQLPPIVDQIDGSLSVAERMALIDECGRALGYSVDQKSLSSPAIERMSARMQALQTLMKPLRMDVHSDLIERLNGLLDRANQHLQVANSPSATATKPSPAQT